MNSNKATVLSDKLNTVRTADQLCLLIQEHIRHHRGDSELPINKESFQRYFQELKLPVSID